MKIRSLPARLWSHGESAAVRNHRRTPNLGTDKCNPLSVALSTGLLVLALASAFGLTLPQMNAMEFQSVHRPGIGFSEIPVNELPLCDVDVPMRATSFETFPFDTNFSLRGMCCEGKVYEVPPHLPYLSRSGSDQNDQAVSVPDAEWRTFPTKGHLFLFQAAYRFVSHSNKNRYRDMWRPCKISGHREEWAGIMLSLRMGITA
jgi:hypothetical protein